MIRIASLLLIVALSGCTGPFAEQNSAIRNKMIETPNANPASTEVASRVDTIGRKLLAGSPFLFNGDPAFQIVGLKDLELFHRDSTSLFVTEGVIQSCKTDDEVAAVLASEMGRMVSEQRRTTQMKLPEPMPSSSTSIAIDVTSGGDPVRAIEQADLEKNYRKPVEQRMLASSDPKTIAINCMKDAGYDPEALKQVDTLICRARRGTRIANHFAQTGN